MMSVWLTYHVCMQFTWKITVHKQRIVVKSRWFLCVRQSPFLSLSFGIALAWVQSSHLRERLGYGILSCKIQDGRRSVHPGLSPRAPRQQLILARLPPYIDVRYSVRQLGTFGHVSSTFAGGVREQRLRFFFCIGSIGACAENRIFSPLIQDGGRSF